MIEDAQEAAPEQPIKFDEHQNNTRAVQASAQQLLGTLNFCKPDERSNLARRYAIAITEAEKLYAWIETWL